jgi:hypothetical protein
MQPAPFGAQCALHAGIIASAVCARCGNFMCASCAVGGLEAQCPTCRSLHVGGFPFDANADMSALLGHVWAGFQREFPMILVATILFFAFAAGGGIAGNVISSIITAMLGLTIDETRPMENLGGLVVSVVLSQAVGMVINLVVQAIALVGFYRVLMDVLIGRKADVARMFSQLHRFAQFVLLQVLFFLLITLPMMVMIAAPLGYGFAKAFARGGRPDFEQVFDPTLIALTVGGAMLALVFTVVLLPVMFFAVPELMVSDCTAIEAMRRSWVLGEGQRLRLLGYSLMMGLITLFGLVLCFVGVIPAVPFAYMLLLALFLALRNSSQLPPAQHG